MRFACKNFENVNISSFESALATSNRHEKFEFQPRKGFFLYGLVFTYLALVFLHMEAMQCLRAYDLSGA